MAFDWKDNLTLARALQATPPPLTLVPVSTAPLTEALHRCIVGRAYYAAYGRAFQYATAYLGFRGKRNADDHGGLRAHLRRRRRFAVSDHLDELRLWRNACDYDADLPAQKLPELATRAIGAAQYVIDALPPPTPANL